MDHEEVLVAAAAADGVHEPARLFLVVGIRMEEDGAVVVTLGRGDEQVRHVLPVELPFRFAHLVPLMVAAMAGMDLAEGFHRQEEDKLEVGDQAGQRTAFERRDESFARCHGGIL